MRILVVGAGLMGAQIGAEYALGGHQVSCLVRDDASARARLRSAFETSAKYGLAEQDAATRVLDSIDILTAIPKATETFDVIVESLPENLEQKVEVIKPLAAAFPDAIVASNTSSIGISLIGEGIGAAERTIGTHYWNPPLLMPMVEVIAGDRTRPDVIDTTLQILRQLGKRPVLAKRDVPGFVWNRLQFALLREAVWIVENGVASPDTIDEVVRDGLARRWSLTGPFETASLGGGATFEKIARLLLPHLSDAKELQNLEQWLIHDSDKLQRIKSRRDVALAEKL